MRSSTPISSPTTSAIRSAGGACSAPCKGYGERLQLSVWQCRLGESRRIEMAMALEAHIDAAEDHVLIVDLGPAAGVQACVESFGKTFEPIERRATVL